MYLGLLQNLSNYSTFVSNRTRTDETLQKHISLYVIYGHLREKNKKCGRVIEVGENINDKNIAFRFTLGKAA